LSEETLAVVVERTSGVPLFVEELTRSVLEGGDARLMGREIPATLHDSLMARLDRLGRAKEVAQVGAVIGGEFSYELLRAVYPIAEEDLQRALRSLADAELLYVRGIAPDATYQFKHALIRDAAYEALLKSRRRDLHQLVARTINAKFPTLKETQPEVLARHWTEAGEIESAITEWSRAGKVAETRYAFREALGNYEQAVALLNLLPESPERNLRELELRQLAVRMLQMTSGLSAPETIEATRRGAEAAEEGGNLTQLVTWVISRCINAHFAGDISATGVLADQALELALREGSPTHIGHAYNLQILAGLTRADLAGVEKHFTIGLPFFEDPGLKHFPGATVAAFGGASWSAWMLGRPDVARQRKAHMMAKMNENNPHDVVITGIFAAQLRVYMREYEQAETLAARTLELSEKNQFPHPAAHSRCILGHARAYLGRADEGVALIRQGITTFLEAESRFLISNFYAWLAAALERDGNIADALETVEQALQANADELVYRPETFRLRGELRLKQGQTEMAEADFRESIALAQKMGAKAWELRATMSLARLLASQGRRDEGRAMLAKIYGWFTEGFDTADLKDAKALLNELAA
jgi:tetratricopeptide (TPR) repeat protein